MKFPVISFLRNRAIGMTQSKQQIERTTGIPISKAYLERKVDNMIIKSIWDKLVMSKRVYLIVALLFTFQFNYAQLVERTYSDETENGIVTQSGSFSISEAPVEFNLPNGFVYLDANTTKSILGYWGNDTSTLQDVIGMIIPESTPSVQDIDRAWIMSYRNVGHVQDNKAGNMGFKWILDGLRYSDNYKNAQVGWAWTPKYDTQHHRLSLPLMYVEGTDTTLNHRQIMFGNEGIVQMDPIIPLSDLQWLYDNDDLINDAVGFTQGSRYEDFDSTKQKYAYKSVSAFIKGVPANASESDFSEVQPNEEESSTPSFIGIIGIIAAVLVSIMLILMLAVTITNKKDETGKDIVQSGVNVLLRIGVFWMVYLLIFTFAIFLIWAGIWLTIGILSEYISIRALIAIVGGWIIIGGFLWAIIKSLFVFSRSENLNRLEIHQSDAPKLFALIEEISHSAGEKMPKHVYVSPEVNACVFYDKPLMSLFFHTKKNLEVGLGLLFGLNKQEFKAVIAHEYGHFGQKSMRIGQVVSTCYNIISNLVNSEQASIVRPILRKTFVYVQRGFMTLSRSMEYEADCKSAMVAGNGAAISALCKIEIIAERFSGYNSLVQNIYESKKILPTSYWNGYKQFLSLTDNFDGITLDETVIATAQLSSAPKSKVRLKNPWISHPLLEHRIENIRSLNYISSISTRENIQDVISEEVYDQTSHNLFVNASFTSGEICSDPEYRDLLAKELDEKSFPISMRVFFNRELCGFEINKNDEETFSLEAEEVFSENKAHIVEKFVSAISDYQTLVMFKNKQTTEKQIQYDGAVYNRKNVPVETQLEIVKGLETRVISIDKDVCLLALSKTKDKDLIMKAYDNVFYSQAIIRHIANNILPHRDAIAKQIGNGGSKEQESFKRIQRILLSFKASMRELIDNMEIERLNPVMHVDTAKSIKRVEDDWLLEGDSIDGEEIQYIFTLPDHIIAQFRSLAYYSKKIVSDTIEDKTPLMFWNNSVAYSHLDNQNKL